jgi:alpha-1,3-mannosyltransferase
MMERIFRKVGRDIQAHFFYLFSLFSIHSGQYIFGVVYMSVLVLVLRLYYKGNQIPFYAYLPLILSKIIHSIFVLRLFNDCIAVLVGYLAFNFFLSNKVCPSLHSTLTPAHFSCPQWRWGCLFYSSAVSIKMNMLLYSPGILLCLLLSTGFYETFICLAICAVWQLILGYPFLSTYPIDYLKNSFDIGRVFMFKWTVNFKFLPEEIFVSKPLSIGLLLMTVIGKTLLTDFW